MDAKKVIACMEKMDGFQESYLLDIASDKICSDELALSELIERFGLELISDFAPTDWRKGERWITYKVTKE